MTITLNGVIQNPASPVSAGSLPSDPDVVDMDDAVQPSGGSSSTTVGFQLRNATGGAVSQSRLVRLGAYQDLSATALALNATLASPMEGSIVSGTDTALLEVMTDAAGRFSCRLYDLVDEVVYMASSTKSGSSAMDCKEVDAVTFSA